MVRRMKWLAVGLLPGAFFSVNAQNVSSAALQKVIHSFFAQRFQVADSMVKVTYRRLPNLTRFNRSSIQLQCYSQNERRKLGFQSVWVNVVRDGRILVKLPVAVNVQIKKKVIVTTSSIPFHSIIEKNMLHSEERWIKNTEVFEQGFDHLDQVIGLEASHYLPSGKILVQRDVKERTVIHAGDMVEIWVPAGNLVVTAKGIARSAGKIGQYIYVKDATTGKRIRARVQSPNVVIVANKGAL